MKRHAHFVPFLLFLILFSLSVSLTGCAAGTSSASEEGDDGKLRVVVTLFPYYDFVRQIAGDHVHLTMMVPAGMDTHSFEPTPSDLVQLQKADLFVYNGGELEGWVDSMLESISTDRLTVYNVLESLESQQETASLLLEEEDQHEDESGKSHEIDEHIWTSPLLAQTIVSELTQWLCEADPDQAEIYRENAASYLEQLAQLDAQFRETAENSPLSVLVFGDKFPFRYFTHTYELDYYAAFSSCSSETEPSAATLALLIDTVRDQEIPVVYYVELSSQKVADNICEATGAQKLLFHSCHNVTAEEFNDGVTYLDLMKQNLEHLRIGLAYSANDPS